MKGELDGRDGGLGNGEIGEERMGSGFFLWGEEE